MMEAIMAPLGDFVSSSLLSALTGTVLHSGSLNEDISTGQLLSSLTIVKSLSISLPPLTRFCKMVSKSSLVI